MIPRQLLQSPIRFRLVDVHRRHLFHSGAIRNHTVQVFFCGNKKIGVHTFNELRVDALDKIGQIARFDARLHDPPIGFPLRVPMKSDPPLLQPLRSLLVGKGTRPVIHYAYFHIPYGYGHMISGRKFLRILERLRDGLRPVRIRNHALAQKPRHNRARRRFRLGVLVGPGASPPIPFLAIHAILRVVLFFLSPIRFRCGVENSVYLLAGTLMLSVLYYGSRCALGIFYSKFQLLLFRVERIHKPLRARLRPYQPALRRLQLVVPAFGLQLLEKHRIPRGVRHEIGELIGVIPAFFGQRIHSVPASELFDTPRLPLKSLPHDGIRRLLRGIRDNLDSESVRVGQIQLVFLSDDAPFALLQIGRTPRRVEMMQRDKPLLRVHPRSHHVGRTDEYPHIAGIYTSEQLGLLFSSIMIVDKLNLALRNAHFLRKNLAQILVHRKAAVGCPRQSRHAKIGVLLLVLLKKIFGCLYAAILRIQQILKRRLQPLPLFDEGPPFQTLHDPRGIPFAEHTLGKSLEHLLRFRFRPGGRHRIIAKHQLRSSNIVPLIVQPLDISRRPHHLPVSISRKGWVDSPNVQRGDARIVQNPQRIVDASVFGVPRVALYGVHPRGEVIEILGLFFRRLPGVQLPLVPPRIRILHYLGNGKLGPLLFPFRKRLVLPLHLNPVRILQILQSDRIRELLVNLLQRREVHQRRKNAPRLELLRRSVLKTGFGDRVRSGPCVEVLKIPARKFIVCEILHHRVNLDETVRHRRPRSEGDSPAALAQSARLHVHVERLRGPFRVVHSGDAWIPRRILQVLEQVSLVHHKIVDSHFLEIVSYLVPFPFGEFRQPRLVLIYPLLNLLDASRIPSLFRILKRGPKPGKLLVDNRLLVDRRVLYKRQMRMPDDNRVEIPRRHPREKRFSVLRLHTLFGSGKYARTRIELVKIPRPLSHEVIRNHEKRLLGSSHAPTLHRSGDQRIRFPRADHVVEQHGIRPDHPPRRVLLRIPHLDGRVRSGCDKKLPPVEFRLHMGIHLLVERIDNLVHYPGVAASPLLELSRHHLHQHIGSVRCFPVDGAVISASDIRLQHLSLRCGIEEVKNGEIRVVEHPTPLRLQRDVGRHPHDFSSSARHIHVDVLQPEVGEKPFKHARRNP